MALCGRFPPVGHQELRQGNRNSGTGLFGAFFLFRVVTVPTFTRVPYRRPARCARSVRTEKPVGRRSSSLILFFCCPTVLTAFTPRGETGRDEARVVHSFLVIFGDHSFGEVPLVHVFYAERGRTVITPSHARHLPRSTRRAVFHHLAGQSERPLLAPVSFGALWRKRYRIIRAFF